VSRRYGLTWDLNDDPALIAEYKRYPKKIWPEITKSMNHEGVRDLEIYLRGTRMFRMLEADDSFSFEKKLRLTGRIRTFRSGKS
jgi:L-rhamnose mutarotase